VIAAAHAGGFAGLTLDTRAITPALPTDAHAAGVLIVAWAVNDADPLTAWLATDARFVESGRPALAPLTGAR
jgi:hypothetical protein